MQKFYNDFNSTKKSTTSIIFTVINKVGNNSGLSFDLSTGNCSQLRTYGNWEDPNRWRGGKVPSANDMVVIPNQAGVIQLERDITVASIQVSGGIIRAYKSGCPSSWTIDDRSLHT